MFESETPPLISPEGLLRRFRDHGDVAALGALFDQTSPELFRVALAFSPA